MSTQDTKTPEFPLGAGMVYILLGLAFIVLIINQVISIYVETLWFESVGYETVYWYRLSMQLGTFCVFAFLTAAALWLIFRAISPRSDETRAEIEFAGERIILPPAHFFRRAAKIGAVFFGFFFGIANSIDWSKYALFLNRPAPSDIIDPVLNKNLNFYLFELPMFDAISSWFFSITLIATVAAALLIPLGRIIRLRGLSISMTLLSIAAAAKVYLYQFHLIYAEHSLFSGVTYVDENAIIPSLKVITVLLLISAGVSAFNIFDQKPRTLIAAVSLPLLGYIFGWVLVPAYITNFVVRPNELVRETPYIKHNIEHTRRAFGIDDVEEIPFEPAITDARFDPSKHSATIQNVRLWDWRALQATLGQVQEIRTYYDFADVDVDRYEIDGEKRSVMLATRELNLANLPSGSSNWINERLIFTHGYGVTMNPVNRFTSEGLPEFILHDMPVESTVPGIEVTRPEVYFGEMTNWPVYVKTQQKEFNYPEGESNNYSTYEGEGGIKVGGLLRRLLLAYQTGELTTQPFAEDITEESQLLIRRNIRQRVQTIAPFLVYDDDAYIVVGVDGALYWIIDAFTVANTYPYARQVSFGRMRVNYIRNSVKVVVNAYTGETRFYVFEPEDPVIQAYQRTFPDLFVNADTMPDGLRLHTRYPELLFRIQALVYATYHVGDEQVFYNQEDLWSVAQQGRSQAGSDEIEPYFVLMRFPGEEEVEFVSILPFTPSNRNNLIGWMAARSDGAAYGKLRAYQFPKTRFIDGPLQIEARIDQDPQLSSQLSLWNQQGSTVLRGNLLVIPLEKTLLFVAPIYLQAERSPMPELRIVVLATQDRMASAPTFEEALIKLLRPDPSMPHTQSDEGNLTPPSLNLSNNRPLSLLQAATSAFEAYQRLTAEGRLAEAGEQLERLKAALTDLRRAPEYQN